MKPSPDTTPGKDSDEHRRRNYAICKGIDLITLGIALEDMVKAGMPKELAEIYRLQANTLLALIRTENNRIFSEKAKQ